MNRERTPSFGEDVKTSVIVLEESYSQSISKRVGHFKYSRLSQHCPVTYCGPTENPL